MRRVDLAVIGGGPAGLAAAIEAKNCGLRDVVILERDNELGGILQQCIHNGFGLHLFKEELTGPEYAHRFIKQAEELGIECKTGTLVLNITGDKLITAVNSREGLFDMKAGAVVLAMGCRERTRGALNIPGTRPAGIYTAGTAQRFVNMEGFLPGRKVVILGSGDIGLIMARRMTLEGAEVKMVCEIMPYSNGLARNRVQCLDDYGIPLRLCHTVVGIYGKERLEGVSVAKVDENRRPVPGTEEFVACDTLLLSVGLIPENELSREAGIQIDPATSGPVVDESMQTLMEGFFACGNVVHVHDLVDHVTEEGRLAGRCAALYVQKGMSGKKAGIRTAAGRGVRYVVPHIIHADGIQKESKLLFRTDNVYRNVEIVLKNGDKKLYSVRRTKVSPGEMESIPLRGRLAQQLKGCDEIVVQVGEVCGIMETCPEQ